MNSSGDQSPIPVSRERLQNEIVGLLQRHLGQNLDRHVLLNTVSVWFHTPREEVEAAYRQLVEAGRLTESTPSFWSQLRGRLAQERMPVHVHLRN